jgi:L-asparaginase
MAMYIKILTTGGTIDKVYFDAKSSFQVGEPQIVEVLREANLTIDYRVTALMKKDSLDMTEDDRLRIRRAVEVSDAQHIVITHGTDTMIATGIELQNIPGKTIVLTGAMQPARFRTSDALYNIASAMTAVQLLPAGVYIIMNGTVFNPLHARKNIEANRFESV